MFAQWVKYVLQHSGSRLDAMLTKSTVDRCGGQEETGTVDRCSGQEETGTVGMDRRRQEQGQLWLQGDDRHIGLV